MGLEPGAEPALRAEHQHIDEAGDHRRNREWQIDKGRQEALAAKLEFGDGPGGRQAENRIERYRDGGDEQGQPHRRQGIGIEDRGKIRLQSLGQGLRIDRRQGQHEKQAQVSDGEQQQEQTDP